MTRKLAFAIGFAAVLGFPFGLQAAPVPGAGIYFMASLTVKVGPGCTDHVGNIGFGTFHYPGHNRPGATINVPKINNFAVRVYTLPTTPNIGKTAWKGKFTKQEKPGGTVTNGTFTATLTFIDSATFLIDITTGESDTGCVEENQLTLLETG